MAFLFHSLSYTLLPLFQLLHQLFPRRSPSFLLPTFLPLSLGVWIIIYNICRGDEGEGMGVLNHQTPPHMKAAPSSGLHYWHTDIWDIFFHFSNNRRFDLWTGIRISLQESYRWKDNREWEICPRGEKLILSSRTVLLVIPSFGPVGNCFVAIQRTHLLSPYKLFSESFWIL